MPITLQKRRNNHNLLSIQAKFQVVEGDATYASIDGILSVLMMMRLYLVGKFVVVHSQLLTNKSTQNVSAVSHVKININFVLKVSNSES